MKSKQNKPINNRHFNIFLVSIMLICLLWSLQSCDNSSNSTEDNVISTVSDEFAAEQNTENEADNDTVINDDHEVSEDGENDTASGSSDETETEDVFLNLTSSDYEILGRNKFGFVENGKNYYGLLNKKADVIFVDDVDFRSSDCGYGIIEIEYPDGNSIIINDEGDKIASSLDGDYEKILAINDRMILLYKYTGTMTSVSYSLKILDLTDGTYSRDWYNAKYDQKMYLLEGRMSYIGEGIFCYDDEYGIYMYNSITDNGKYLTAESIGNERKGISLATVFVDGKCYLYSDSKYSRDYRGGLVCDKDFNLVKGTPDGIPDIEHYTNGTLKCALNGFVAYDLSNGYLEILNMRTMANTVIKEIPTGLMYNYPCFVDYNGYQNYVVQTMLGVDKKTYFTVIRSDDSGAKMLFDFIEFKSEKSYNGYELNFKLVDNMIYYVDPHGIKHFITLDGEALPLRDKMLTIENVEYRDVYDNYCYFYESSGSSWSPQIRQDFLDPDGNSLIIRVDKEMLEDQE